MVFEELEWQFEVKVKLLKELVDWEYIGFFESGDLNVVFEAICWLMGLAFELNDGKVIILDNL